MKWKIGTSLVVGVAVVSVGLSLFVTGYWSTEVSESTGAVAAVSESEGDGSHDGIKVHGEYEIEVRDPDGTLVAKRVVPNTVTSYGKSRIAAALNGSAAPSIWFLRILGSPAACGSPGGCGLQLGSATYTEHAKVQNTLKKTQSGGTLNFSGSYIAGVSATGKITQIDLINANNGNVNFRFSQASVSPTVNFTKGQTINLSYTISFN